MTKNVKVPRHFKQTIRTDINVDALPWGKKKGPKQTGGERPKVLPAKGDFIRDCPQGRPNAK